MSTKIRLGRVNKSASQDVAKPDNPKNNSDVNTSTNANIEQEKKNDPNIVPIPITRAEFKESFDNFIAGCAISPTPLPDGVNSASLTLLKNRRAYNEIIQRLTPLVSNSTINDEQKELLIECYVVIGQFNKALDLINKFFSLNELSFQVKMLHAICLYSTNQVQDAMDMLYVSLSALSFKKNENTKYSRLRARSTETLEKELISIKDISDEQKIAHQKTILILLMNCCIILKDYVGALSLIQELYYIIPKNEHLWKTIRLCIQISDTTESQRYMEILEKSEKPQYYDLILEIYKGLISMNSKDYPQAIIKYRNILDQESKLDESNGIVRDIIKCSTINLSICYFNTCQYQEAIKLLEAMILKNPILYCDSSSVELLKQYYDIYYDIKEGSLRKNNIENVIDLFHLTLPTTIIE